MSSDQNPAPPGPSGGPGGTRRPGEPGWPRWSVFVLLGVILLVLIGSSLLTSSEGEPMSYGDFLEALENDQVAEATFNNTNGHITGELDDGTQFSANGPIDPPDADTDLMAAKGVEFETPESSVWLDLIIWTAPLPALPGVLHLAPAAGPEPDGQRHVHRPLQGEDLLRRAPGHDVRRRGRLRRRQAGDHRGGRLPEVPGALRRDRCPHPQGGAARRSPGNRQDPHRPGRRR